MISIPPRLVVVALAVFSMVPAAVAGLSPEEQKIVAYVDAHRDEFATDLEAAVQINSATEHLAGVRQMADFFVGKFAAIGLDARFVPLPPETGRAGHFLAEHRGHRGKRVLIIGHLDTVFPGANWSREGNRANGAGVGDMKGGDLVALHALKALAGTVGLDDTQIIVVFTGDEELPGRPISTVRQTLRDAAARSDVALAFESAVGLTGTVARRGHATWKLVTQGVTGHSSGIFSALDGSGSVYEAARILHEFHDELKTMDGITANPALIAGGTPGTITDNAGTATGKPNIIAQRTEVIGDLRFISAEQLADAKARMQAIVARHLPRTSAELTFNEGYPAMPPTPENYALLAQLDQVSRDLGTGAITAFDPRARGAGDIAFVSPPLPGLDGLGLGGQGEHTIHESGDLTPAPDLIKRAALLIYRLTR
ncbi:MAG: M20/M25/M40 family metallo-hydrolase [Verrucomicrobia bacterium]|nr:M20/M25/M40 family metallo-hydrolase [Verrucomicrobiota bacterium]